MTDFIKNLRLVTSYKRTENGAFALSSTQDPLLDAFGTLAAMRGKTEKDILSTFINAYMEDKLLALRMLFYVRDIHEGQGERDIFRLIATYLAFNDSETMKRNLPLIPLYGRFDDLYSFAGTPLEADAFAYLKKVYEEDLKKLSEGKPVSLLGKWLKSVNASDKQTCRLGSMTASYFCISEKRYRKELSALRKAIDVVEKKMSSSDFASINFEAVPSYAHKAYRNAFRKHDGQRYEEYTEALKNGKAEIKASTLFPYDLIHQYMDEDWEVKHSADPIVEAQWKNLPNFISGDKNFLVMADVSGSMYGTPMEISVGLAIYFAQRAHGAFHGSFLSFTDVPKLHVLKDNASLHDRIFTVMNHVGYSTNLCGAFQAVLSAAVEGHIPQAELPDYIVVISDMEIDDFGGDISFTSMMKEKFEAAGYTMPTLVYWNVNARNNTFHAVSDDNVRFLSGASATNFKYLCESKVKSAHEMMEEILNAPRYQPIQLA